MSYKFNVNDSVELVHDENSSGKIVELVTSDNEGELVESTDDQNPWYIIEWDDGEEGYVSFDPEEHLIHKGTK